MDRRKFMKVAGVAALGLTGGTATRPLAEVKPRGTGRKAPLVGRRWAMVIDLRKCREAQRGRDCKDCIDACPLGVMQFNNETRVALKCDLCVDRLEEGLQPACVAACPSHCLHVFGGQKLIIQ